MQMQCGCASHWTSRGHWNPATSRRRRNRSFPRRAVASCLQHAWSPFGDSADLSLATVKTDMARKKIDSAGSVNIRLVSERLMSRGRCSEELHEHSFCGVVDRKVMGFIHCRSCSCAVPEVQHHHHEHKQHHDGAGVDNHLHSTDKTGTEGWKIMPDRNQRRSGTTGMHRISSADDPGGSQYGDYRRSIKREVPYRGSLRQNALHINRCSFFWALPFGLPSIAIPLTRRSYNPDIYRGRWSTNLLS